MILMASENSLDYMPQVGPDGYVSGDIVPIKSFLFPNKPNYLLDEMFVAI